MREILILIVTCVLHIFALNAKSDVRLPKSIWPEAYKLTVVTHLNDQRPFKFFGEVAMKLVVNETTNVIKLHSKKLNIRTDQIQVVQLNEDGSLGGQQLVMGAGPEEENDIYTIDMVKPLKAKSKYILLIPFNSQLSEGLMGYYRSSYIDKKLNEKRFVAVTQFEPTSAREAFPCFDEPAMKATFEISIGHHKNFTALSNMPLLETVPMDKYDDGFVLSQFKKSVPMSTYIVAYGIFDFVYKESMVEAMQEGRFVQFRTWARPEAFSQLQYASDTGPKVLQFFEKYFNLDYPLPKVDQLAIPDFSSGAMENWGMVTYRESALLFEPNVSSSSSQSLVAKIISHELAHMWFGNLVTMEWWTDLWLNEGFATYVASLGVEYLHPEWNSYVEESLNNIQDIFEFDALKSSHPVSVEVNHPDEIKSIFDVVSYKKGSSIIRMMHLFLGDEVFREGVSNYLKEFSYRNAKQMNLWDSLTKAAHKHEMLPENLTVGMIMDTWTLQTGYPIIRVERNYEDNTALITQKRYLKKILKSKEDESTCWWVPLTYTQADATDFNSTTAQNWIGCDENGVAIPLTIENTPEKEDWFIFNIGVSALYRVQYDEHNWKLLVDFLMGPNYKDISVANRAQLVSDALNLAWSGEQKDYSIALNMLEYLRKEREYIPWNSAVHTLAFIKRMLARTPEYGHFQQYMQKLLLPVFNDQGGLNVNRKPTDSQDVVKFKILINNWSCKMGIEQCVSKAKELFQEWQLHPNRNTIPSDIRRVVYCTAIGSGNERDWQFLWKQYLKSNVASEKSTILVSLGCSRDIWVLQRYLEWSLQEKSGIRKQDSVSVFHSVVRADVGFNLARAFLLERVAEIHNYHMPDSTALNNYVKSLAAQFKSQKEYNELTGLIESKPQLFENIRQAVDQALETIEINMQWEDKNYNSIGQLLSNINAKIC